ncbi:MAG TPA: type II restriction endonuclease [Puia sp.]|jgi:type II restriction enzyme
MESLLRAAIETAQKAECAYTKFITPNDTGATGAHQSGFHIHMDAWPLFFKTPGERGDNKDESLTITWQNELVTQSRAIYYGVSTRNEYRLTRFGKGFPYLQEDNIGDLLVLCRLPKKNYQAYVLQADEDIDEFFAALNISPANANGLIEAQVKPPEDALEECFNAFLASLKIDFPDTELLSRTARECYRAAYLTTDKMVMADPDKEILKWLESEFQLFRLIENDRYSERIKHPFPTVEDLIETANTLLQRRKSRAGFSLEHHLAAMFRLFGLKFDEQGTTEGKKKPDFIFPGTAAYRDSSFDTDKLFVLAAKTTCKDRWRQVMNEADRVTTKYLFTLQQGISSAQLEEMYAANVCLVVPKAYLTSFPPVFRGRILTLEQFVQRVLEKA